METTRSSYRAVRRRLAEQGNSRPARLGGRRKQRLDRQWVLHLPYREPDGETKARDLGPQTRVSEGQFCHTAGLHGPPCIVRDVQGSGPVTGPSPGRFPKSAMIFKSFSSCGIQTKSQLDVQHGNNCPGQSGRYAGWSCQSFHQPLILGGNHSEIALGSHRVV